MLGSTRFVWMLLCAQFLCCTATRLLSATPSESELHYHHKKISIMTTQRLIGTSNQEMYKSKSLWCRRCLQIHEDDEAPAPAEDEVATADPPMTDLPTLPTDPEASAGTAPPAPRTNPSSLLAPSGTSGTGSPGGGGVMSKSGSGLANTVGISAGVGASAGVTVLLMAVLYYFKPDIFLCCKTCVRVQVFHHSHSSAAATSKK